MKMPASRFKRADSAFTRIELLAAGVALLLIVLVVAPTLASNKTDSERLVCSNNLRLIGRAVHMWGGNHDQQPPWRTSADDGGLMPTSSTPRPGNAWFDFAFLSNQLVTPKILACPSDVGVLKASNFVVFTTPLYRSFAVSYVIGLESVADSPRAWLSGDRNLGGISSGGPCSSRVHNVGIINLLSSPSPLRWTNGVAHGEFGHILLMDGSVEFTSTARLKMLLLSPEVHDNGSVHFSKAR